MDVDAFVDLHLADAGMHHNTLVVARGSRRWPASGLLSTDRRGLLIDHGSGPLQSKQLPRETWILSSELVAELSFGSLGYRPYGRRHVCNYHFERSQGMYLPKPG